MTSEAGLWNVANVLTIVRIVLVPVFVGFLLAGGTAWRLAALGTFCVASLTDVLDGRLARSRGLVTDFGKIADPVADKALTGAALICLSALGELPWWVTGVIMFRELGVTALRFWVIRRGVIAASRGGKAKTLLQIIAICLYLLPASLSPPALVRELFMAAAVVVTVVTGADYVIQAMRLRRSQPERPEPATGRGVTALRFWVIRRGVIAASRGGKAKTLLQIIAICLYLLPASLSPPALVRELFMAAAVVVTVVTGADYVLQALRLRRSEPERSEPATGR